MAAPPLIVVVGETASGKSAIAMELARKFDGEIINSDSWAIYREMDIGTAKPTMEDRKEIPHHLLDITDPNADFTVALYKNMAQTAIDDISSRGKLPILVGGSGLYVDSVLFDYSFARPGDEKLREELKSKSIDELLELIDRKQLDMTGIDIRNKRRLIRLIETDGDKPTKSELRPNTLIIGVRISRTKLRQRIENRVEQMIKRGLKHEVQELADKYGWEVEAMKGIGYREFRPYLSGEQSMGETKRKIIKSTIGLAKNQRTWFKRNKDIIWFDNRGQAVEIVTSFFGKLNK